MSTRKTPVSARQELIQQAVEILEIAIKHLDIAEDLVTTIKEGVFAQRLAKISGAQEDIIAARDGIYDLIDELGENQEP